MSQSDSDRQRLADEREAALDERGAALDKREAVLAAREVALAERMDAAGEILTAADTRDQDAGDRDAAAVDRENALDKKDFVSQESQESAYGDRWPERRSAGLDRVQSKNDRAASHEDWVALTEDQD